METSMASVSNIISHDVQRTKILHPLFTGASQGIPILKRVLLRCAQIGAVKDAGYIQVIWILFRLVLVCWFGHPGFCERIRNIFQYFSLYSDSGTICMPRVFLVRSVLDLTPILRVLKFPTVPEFCACRGRSRWRLPRAEDASRSRTARILTQTP